MLLDSAGYLANESKEAPAPKITISKLNRSTSSTASLRQQRKCRFFLDSFRPIIFLLPRAEACVENWTLPVVSDAKMREGIHLILQNIRNYLKDARVLVSSGSVEHATLLTIYGAEELGKASLLFQTVQASKPEVDMRLFRGQNAHETKMTEARRLLGSLLLLQSSILGRARFPFILGAKEVEASPGLRMDCTFVDFRDDKWVFGATFLRDHLQELLFEIEKQCDVLETKL
jgi:AbiV family abortive infection protein